MGSRIETAPNAGEKPIQGGSYVDPNLIARAATLRSTPAFARAVETYVRGQGAFQKRSRLVNALVSNDARWRVISYVTYLAFDVETYGRLGGATGFRLVDFCSSNGEAKPRTVKTMLALLQLTGFVRVLASPDDKRVKHYQPSEKLYGYARDWVAAMADTLDVAEPGRARGRRIREDRPFFERTAVEAGRIHMSGGQPHPRAKNARIAELSARMGGASVICAVLIAAHDGAALDSAATLARRYALSKSQVSALLTQGHRRGLFGRDATDGFVPTPLLLMSMGEWVSYEVALFAVAMDAAEQVISLEIP